LSELVAATRDHEPPSPAAPEVAPARSTTASFVPAAQGIVVPAPRSGLVVGHADDPAEAEADTVARDVVAVLRRGSSSGPRATAGTDTTPGGVSALRRHAVVVRRDLDDSQEGNAPRRKSLAPADWLPKGSQDYYDQVSAATRLDASGEASHNWADVKTAFKKDDKTLGDLVAWRKDVVKALLKQMRAEFGVGARAAGSEALTSDYDITFTKDPADCTYTPGPDEKLASPPRPEAAVAAFNARFRTTFGDEPGWFFDTNVYAEDFLFDPNRKLRKDALAAGVASEDVATLPKATERNDEVTQLSDHAQRRDGIMQDRNALVKIRKNLSQADWDTLRDQVLGQLSDVDIKRATKAQFRDAEQLYKNFYVKKILEDTPQELKQHAIEQEPRLDGDDIALADYVVSHSSEGFKASNLNYEKHLTEVAKLSDARAKLEDSVPPEKRQGDANYQAAWDQMTLRIREEKSRALLFANEPYFSAGTLFHVVGNLQAGWGLALDIPTLFQSLNENYGDFLKEIRHQRAAMKGVPDSELFVPIATKCSKYGFRFSDSATRLQQAGVIAEQPVDLPTLRECQRKLLAIRQGDALDAAGETIKPKNIEAERMGPQSTLTYKDSAGPDKAGTEVPVSKDWGSTAHDRDNSARDAATYLAAAGVDSLATLEKWFKEIHLVLNKAVRETNRDKAGGKK
jgi:hypothetical protein